VTTDPLRTFGLTLRRLRQQHGLSQEKLAELADLDRTYVSGIERGKRNVSLVNIILIAGALRIRPGKLFSDL